MERGRVEFYESPRLRSPALVVLWQTQDIGRLGTGISEFLRRSLELKEIAEIEPLGFFPFGGVRFKDDLVQVPQSKFYACEVKDLLIFESDEPSFEHFQFLSALCECAQSRWRVREIYTVNGSVSMIAHTAPRRIFTVFNQMEFGDRLKPYGLHYLTWEGPPAMSSYLLWMAKKRGVPGASLWPEIPFYLGSVGDPQSMKHVLAFFNERFDLQLDLQDVESAAMVQNVKLARLREENPDVDRCISRLESGGNLDEEEQLRLVREVRDFLLD